MSERQWEIVFDAGRLPVSRDDLVRVERWGDEVAIALADAGSAPFELIAPALSRSMIDAAMAAWQHGAGAAAAVERAAEVVAAAEGEAPSGAMLFARIGHSIDVAWVGLAEAWLVRDGRVVERTRPHSLQALHGPRAPPVATRVLSRNERAVADVARWSVDERSLLVCIDRGLALEPGELPRPTDDLAAAARRLAEAVGGARPGRPFAAVLLRAE